MSKTLSAMTAEVDEFCQSKGWRDKPITFGEAMALLHSEVSEALEAYRRWGVDDSTEDRHASGQPHQNAAGVDPCPSASCPIPKPEGVGSEFADVLIRLLDDCALFGVDLEAEYERKMAYNRTRSHRHGGKRL